jgi:CMP-N,N'-diacetyllegionaminic acid synthase
MSPPLIDEPRAGVADPLLVIIPARGGSKRLPGKNLRRLEGTSLLVRTIETVRAADITAPCLLTTDDPVIAREGESVGYLVPFLRPAHLSGDAARAEDAVLHALDWYRDDRGADPDLLLMLQITSPLRSAYSLGRSLRRLRDDPGVDAVLGVKPLNRTARQIFTADSAGVLAPVASDDSPVLTANGAIYLIRTAVFRAQGNFVPARTVGLVMDPIESVDIDTEFDWRTAEAACDLMESGGQS